MEEEGGARGTRRGAWQHCRRGDEEESVAASAARWRVWRRWRRRERSGDAVGTREEDARARLAKGVKEAVGRVKEEE